MNSVMDIVWRVLRFVIVGLLQYMIGPFRRKLSPHNIRVEDSGATPLYTLKLYLCIFGVLLILGTLFYWASQ